MALTEHKTDNYHCFTDKQGRRQGEYTYWYENGQPWEHFFYVDDKKQGEYKAWHHNGQPRAHCFYVGDALHGEAKWWHTNGQPWEHWFCVDGKKVIDFLEEPEKYPKTPEERTWFALKYGSGGWL